MVILRCKMCGGDLTIEKGKTIAVCEYCGTRQTVPTADSDKKIQLFSRANRLRYNCEFDQAANLYESIISEFPNEAEAYWGLVLCKYGIEYVDDPVTGKKIPTCHRTQYENVLEDMNLKQAIQNADVLAKEVYLEEANKIEELRKNVIAISNQEKPYDIFISYKEKDDEGNRTIDSVLAQDLYDQLTQKGYRVFFSRISLEDKIGQQYEPYIFAALHSAKVMIVIGTDYEYFNAIWVKNEWKRFLKFMTHDHNKVLIPCYKDMDAYDMPKEFIKLQAQDLGKVGATQDLLRGIEKILGHQQNMRNTENNNQTPIIQEGMLYRIRSHIDGPDMINRVLAFETNEYNEYWPKTHSSTVINLDRFNYLTFNVILHHPYGKQGNIQFNMEIYDSMGNLITKVSDTVTMQKNSDRLAKQWIMKGKDGSSVSLGKYWALFWIDDSKVFRFQFVVTHRGFYAEGNSVSDEIHRVEDFERQMAVQTKLQAAEKEKLNLQKREAALQVELSELKGLFSGKRRKQIEHELAIIRAQLKNIS